MRLLILFTLLVSLNAYAGRYDHLFDGNASVGDLCRALTEAMGERQAPAADPSISDGLDAVMDYFLFGRYVNARWIEDAGLASHVEPSLIERARQEFPETKFKRISRILDTLIETSEPTVTETIVWRGQMPNIPPPRNGRMYEVGERIVFPQYLSTTNSEPLALSYSNGVLFKITVPAGERALNVQRFMRQRDSQYESLFGRVRTVIPDVIGVRGTNTYIEGHLEAK